MRAGGAAVCPGEVLHCRLTPTRHEFRYPVSYVWLDPDQPGELCGHHPLWSERWPAPARFRRRDYGLRSAGSLGESVRTELEDVVGRRPAGMIRMLTQVRRWGWLFNPITVYLAWDADPDVPVGAVLEVTNTPWKERHRYAVALASDDDPDGGRTLRGRVAKSLHVSPFLDEEFDYAIRVRHGADGALAVGIDVVASGADGPTVATELRVQRLPAGRGALRRSLVTNVASTHRVSLGIHVQALRLWLRRVPFVSHPSKRAGIREDRSRRVAAHQGPNA